MEQDFLVFEDGSVQVTNGSEEVQMHDGSIHLVPVINKAAMTLATAMRTNPTDIKLDPCTSGENSTRLVVVEKEHWTDVADIVRNNEKLFDKLKQLKLISNFEICPKCNNYMKWTKTKSNTEGYRWYCSKCRTAVSIKKDSFFSKTRIPIGIVYQILYFWSASLQGYLAMNLMPNVNKNTIYDFYNFARDICVETIKQTDNFFKEDGDFEIELQIDESVFGKSRKYNRGKAFKQTWVFGISQPVHHRCYLELVKDRSATTLINIISKYVPRTARIKIVSDGWASYNSLSEMGYNHAVVVHKEEFVNQLGEHTNSVESVWSQAKNWIASMHGVRRENLDNYLCEFMFRYNFCGSSRGYCWTQLLENIAKIYKVNHH